MTLLDGSEVKVDKMSVRNHLGWPNLTLSGGMDFARVRRWERRE